MHHVSSRLRVASFTVVTMILVACDSNIADAVSKGAPLANLFVGDFENCDIDAESSVWDGADIAKPRRLAIVSAPVRKGNCALRVELRPQDGAAGLERRNRAEVKHANRDGRGTEVYVAFSVLVPEDYPDPPSGKAVIMAQWKALPPPGQSAAEYKRRGHVDNPTIALRYSTGKQGKMFHVRYGIKGVKKVTAAKCRVLPGQWNDFVFHIRWSQGDDGFVQVWHNGESISKGKVRGANMYAHNGWPYQFKFGQYMGKSRVLKPAVVYFDEIRMGRRKKDVEP